MTLMNGSTFAGTRRCRMADRAWASCDLGLEAGTTCGPRARKEVTMSSTRKFVSAALALSAALTLSAAPASASGVSVRQAAHQYLADSGPVDKAMNKFISALQRWGAQHPNAMDLLLAVQRISRFMIRRAQLVNAISSASLSLGLCQSRVFRGRPLSLASAILRSSRL